MTRTDHPLTATPTAEPTARAFFGVPDDHGAPHHDADAIKSGDYVVGADKSGFIRFGIAHHQDPDGDWCTEAGKLLNWPNFRADRPDALTVWPAPTPPAEEITLPAEHPAHITDVETAYGTRCAHMALGRNGRWVGVDQDGESQAYRPHALVTFTLPDGTRARRDGEREDGTPRFVKAQEEEK